MTLRPIEIDFEIHKAIEAERRSFDEPEHVILRRLLKLGPSTGKAAETQAKQSGVPWSGQGVVLPHGTPLRMAYNGSQYTGEIDNGIWLVGGRRFISPSGATEAVAKTRAGKTVGLNGWQYWEANVDGAGWKRLSDLRKKARSDRRPSSTQAA